VNLITAKWLTTQIFITATTSIQIIKKADLKK